MKLLLLLFSWSTPVSLRERPTHLLFQRELYFSFSFSQFLNASKEKAVFLGSYICIRVLLQAVFPLPGLRMSAIAHMNRNCQDVIYTYIHLFSISKRQVILSMKSTDLALLSVLTVTLQHQSLCHPETKGCKNVWCIFIDICEFFHVFFVVELKLNLKNCSFVVSYLVK